MASHEEPKGESLLDKMTDKIRSHDSSSDSDDDKVSHSKPKIYRLFGREKPIHHVLGGGKPADILLWRNKKLSAGILGGVTAIWLVFDVFGYHLLTFICHSLIVALAGLFLWSNAASFIHKSPPRIPEVVIPEGPVLQVASALTYEFNHGVAFLRDVATGRDLKKFLCVIAGMWIFSKVGGCCNFITLFYISFIMLHSIPVLYEKYEDHVDKHAERGIGEIHKLYAMFEEKVLGRIPSAPLKGKKDA